MSTRNFTLLHTGKYGMLIGDSAYQLTHFMMTPYDKPDTDRKEAFNKGHRRARTKIEHTFGINKTR